MKLIDMSGRTRKWTSWVQPVERYLVDQVVPILPQRLETYHLTLMSIPFAVMVIGVGYLARGNKWWLLGITLFVILQYITDVLDGAVGRYRKTGLVRWGFYMDHFLDYCFVCSLVASYALAYHFPVEAYLIISLVASGGFVHTALWATIQGDYNVSGYYGFGSTEGRLAVVVMNFLLPWFPADLVKQVFLYVIPLGVLIFAWVIVQSQQKLWAQDM